MEFCSNIFTNIKEKIENFVNKAVLRIRIWIQLDLYIIGSPGSGSVYYIRIWIQQLLN